MKDFKLRLSTPSTGGAVDLEQKLLPPLIFAGLLALVALFACLIGVSWSADGVAQHRDEKLAVTALNGWVSRVEAGQSAEATWDDAVDHIQNRLDLPWIDRQMNEWFHQSVGLETMLILDPAGKTLFAGKRGKRAPPASLDAYRAAAWPLIVEVRAAERRRGAMPHGDGKTRIGRAIKASRFVEVEGVPQLVTVNLIQPDFGVAKPGPGPAPLMIGAKVFDRKALGQLAHDLLLEGAGLAPAGVSHHWTMNAVPLVYGGGAPLAAIAWTSRRPGSAIAWAAMPAAMVVTVVTLIGGAWLLRRTRRLTRGLVASQAHALHVALHDTFTSLANRALFEDRLAQAVERRRRYGGAVGVFIIDLDWFKQVNDTLGHASGDQLIQEAARRIVRVCRGTDTVARLGGDEFAVVQPDAETADDVRVLAGRLSEALAGPVELVGGATTLSASVGVAVVDSDELEPIEALRRADLALYRAKDQGRGRYVVFETEMDESARNRQQLAAELARGLDNGEIEVDYQPQLTTRGRQIVAVEALVRWRHPTRGRLAPDVFIPLAEEGELIERIGLYVLRQACEDARRWPGIVTAVNVSAVQLRRDGFLDSYLEVVRAAGIPPSQIELELTETVLLERDERTARMLKRLHEAGFLLALDDFGAGHSSLSYLRLYPLHKIKIDRSYIAPLVAGSDEEAMVLAIVKLAKALRLSVTAEGVETTGQLDILARAGCTLVQGFLFSQAVPAAEIERMLGLGGGQLAA